MADHYDHAEAASLLFWYRSEDDTWCRRDDKRGGLDTVSYSDSAGEASVRHVPCQALRIVAPPSVLRTRSVALPVLPRALALASNRPRLEFSRGTHARTPGTSAAPC